VASRECSTVACSPGDAHRALLATVAMEHALVTHDFSIVFVAENNSKVTRCCTLTGLWSALADRSSCGA